MNFVKEFFSSYGSSLLNSIYICLMACCSYIGLKIKTSVEKYEKDRIKKRIVEDSVKYVEQVYAKLSSKEKYKRAEENILILFKENNIVVTNLELKVLIESACNEFAQNTKEKIKRD